MHANLIEQLTRCADPTRDALVFYDRHARVVDRLSYGQLDSVTDGLAATLKHDHAVRFGDRVVLAFGPGLDFVRAFFACVKIGAIPVPLPSSAGALGRSDDRKLRGIAADSGAGAILADRKHAHIIADAEPSVTPRTARLIAFESLASDRPLDAATPNAILFLQYTSGSTSSPRGVVVSHENALHNAFKALGCAEPTTLSWLPHYHDMGLIGYVLSPLVLGGTAHNFSPLDFVRRPALWLELMTATGASHSSAPNFAFETCLREDKVPSGEVAGYGLHRMESLMSGAEPVRPAVMDRFLAKFAPAGLRAEALIAAYGLAENTLCVSSGGLGRPCFDRGSLDRDRRLVAARDETSGVRLQSCGRPIASVDVRIVDPDSRTELAEGQLGEIWIDGPLKAGGYWNKPELTREKFTAGLAGGTGSWLRTGDIGALHGGELYVQGRIGEMVVSGGANFFPEDVEQALTEALRRSGVGGLTVAAFAERPPEGEETFVAVIESRAHQPIPLLAPLHAIMREMTPAPVATLCVVGHGVVSRTTSGKIARYRIREAWQEGRIDPIERYDVPSQGDDLSAADTFVNVTARLRLLGGNPRIADLNLDSIELVELSVAMETLWKATGHGEGAVPETFFDLGAIGSVRLSDINALMADAADPVGLKRRLLDLLERLTRELRASDARAMRDDATVADGFCPSPDASRPLRPLRLVTGAAGFFGSFLLASLLERTGGDVVALARSSGRATARQRVMSALAETGIFSRIPAAVVEMRLRVIESDLARPRLGLSRERWQELCRDVSDIYHCGAEVDYVKDYSGLRTPNVLGTAAVVEMAANGARKRLHHVSSTMIYGWAYLDVASEAEFNAEMRELDFGYAQTKWVSEQIVLRAFARGLEGRIYRPAFLTASRGGAYARGNVIARILGYMIRHGVATNSGNQLSIIPADIAANNIALLSLDTSRRDRVYNVVTDSFTGFSDYIGIVERAYGYTFDMMPLGRFVEHANRHCSPDDDFYPLRSFMNFHHHQVERMRDKTYDSRRYQAARNATPGTLADAPLELTVCRIVDFLIGKALVPPPRIADAATG